MKTSRLFYFLAYSINAGFKIMKKLVCLLFLAIFICSTLVAQQAPDTTFTPKVSEPTYELGKGPVICIDSAHNNFHTLNGGFAPFARLVRANGFRVKDLDKTIVDKGVLSGCDIYAVINALNEVNLGNWKLPNPSAFEKDEILAINDWVSDGGALFIVADHMPFAGAASELVKTFGFDFRNGFTYLDKEENKPDLFSIENGRLENIELLDAGINSITSFTGSAFTYPKEAKVLMILNEKDYSLEPEVAWQFTEETSRISLGNHAQGAFLNYKKGKIAVFGEAAMFTAQIVTRPTRTFNIGFTSPSAPNNQRFALRLMEYLSN